MPAPRRPIPALLAALILSACGAGDEARSPQADPGVDRAGPARSAPDGARLGVVVVVDQLRSDLLTRYDDLFTGGFRRLLDGGAVFTNTTHDHAETATAPGHTTIATGRFPRAHGVSANSWYEHVEGDVWRSRYAVADTAVSILADPGLPGRSPANIRVDGLGDWVRSFDADARVIGISRKDRGAIPLTGHAAQDAYWLALSDGVAGFTTSTWYHDELPEWVRSANAELTPTLWGDTVWVWQGEDGVRDRARPDEAPYEADGVHTTLPHHSFTEVDMMDRGAWGDWLEDSPATDRAVTTLARHALDALDLGRRGPVDLLAVSYSATDGVGHTFGPLSLEQLDNLLRLDRELDMLMDALDRAVGEDAWTLVLTADHGAADAPEWRVEHGRPGHRVTREERQAADGALAGVTRGDGGVAAAEALVAAGLAADAYPFERLRAGTSTDTLEQLFMNGFVEDRVPAFPGFEVAARMPEGWMDEEFGSTHGSPYHYDRWVPFIVYGPGAAAGVYPERASTVDIAPTLAALLGLPFPDDVDGIPRMR
ncbi:alkaline phosphatase family protein [Gaopeijia maritima]|uniref:alkaline phosphatase family protein n=1 Tax=Gaopeijia maritima TaxID=3119007 RepID=UPI003295826E